MVGSSRDGYKHTTVTHDEAILNLQNEKRDKLICTMSELYTVLQTDDRVEIEGILKTLDTTQNVFDHSLEHIVDQLITHLSTNFVKFQEKLQTSSGGLNVCTLNAQVFRTIDALHSLGHMTTMNQPTPNDALVITAHKITYEIMNILNRHALYDGSV